MLDTLQARMRRAMPDWLRRLVAAGGLLYQDMNKANLFSRASAMAYMTLSSIVPSLAAIFALISAFQPVSSAETAWFGRFRDFVLTNLAPQSGQQIVGYLERFLANLDLAAIGVTGFAGTLAILILLLRNVELTLNEIWQVSDERPFFRRFLFFWTSLTLGAFITSLVVGVLTKLNVSSLATVASDATVLYNAVKVALPLLATFAFFSFLYKIGPNTTVDMKAALLGGLTATILFRVAARLYSIYATNNENYQNIYGALAAVPLFLLWLYIGWLVILFGAILTRRIEHGFGTSAEAIDDTTVTDPIDRERRIQLRALMPLLCIVAVYDRFQRADASGVTGHQLACELEVPLPWMTEGLQTAVAMGYVALSSPAEVNPTAAADILARKIYPTLPPEAVTVDQLVGRFVDDAGRWLDERRQKLPGALTAMIESLRAAITPREAKRTLGDLLALGHRTAASPG